MPEIGEGSSQPDGINDSERVNRANLGDIIETQLNAISAKWGSEREVGSSKSDSFYNSADTPARALLLRYQDLPLVLDTSEWSDEASEDFFQVGEALKIISFPNLSRREQMRAISRLQQNRQWRELFKDRDGITLNPEQTALLARIAGRIDLPYDRQQTFFSFDEIEAHAPKRITEVEFPNVTTILEEAPADLDEKLPYLFEKISGLSSIERTKLMIQLSKEEFDAVVQRRKEAYKELLHDVDNNPDRSEDKEKYIKTRSKLIATRPAWEVDAEIIRSQLETGNAKYSLSMDPLVEQELELQEVVDAGTTPPTGRELE